MADPFSSIPTNLHAVQKFQTEVTKHEIAQADTQENLADYCDQTMFNPLRMVEKFKDLKKIHSESSTKTEEVESEITDVASITETSERFQKNNDELNAKTLRILHSRLSQADTADDILKKVEEVYSDVVLADEALDFLSETTDAQLLAATQEAKEKLNKDRSKEIKAGRNMGAQAREFSKQGLGSPTSLRELYKDITQNQRAPLQLFDELTEKFRYPTLKTALNFMLHSLGSDLKSKGPSIARGELKRLLDETRSMQGILGIFRFFQMRMRLIQREFQSYQLVVPPKLDFELIARILSKILAERFMSTDKLLQTAKFLNIAEETAAQIIIFSQMRDALKQITPKYFRDPKHRDDLLKIFIETIDKLEDKLEEEEEKEKEEKKKEEK